MDRRHAPSRWDDLKYSVEKLSFFWLPLANSVSDGHQSDNDCQLLNQRHRQLEKKKMTNKIKFATTMMLARCVGQLCLLQRHCYAQRDGYSDLSRSLSVSISLFLSLLLSLVTGVPTLALTLDVVFSSFLSSSGD